MPDVFTGQSPQPISKATTPPPSPSVPAKSIGISSPFLENTSPSSTVHFFSSYSENPHNVTFRDQDPDESILLFLRAHVITNIPWIVATIILGFLPILIIFISALGNLFFSFLPAGYIVIFLFIYYLAVATYAFLNFVTWFYNVGLVTTKRVIDIDYSDVVYTNVSATKIDLLRDVKYIQVGVIRTTFNYGDVYVRTEGQDNQDFDFLAVPKPAKAAEIIENVIGERNVI